MCAKKKLSKPTRIMSLDLTRSPPVIRTIGRNDDLANEEEKTRQAPRHTPTFPQTSDGAGPACYTSPAATESYVNEVTVKLLTFMGNIPDIWFQQIESIFKKRRITSDTRKYDLVFEALTPETMENISDFFRKPLETDKYNSIKKLLVQRLTDSKQRQIQKFLNEFQLSDKRPSQLLREMRNLGGDLVHKEFLRTRFLQCMPTNIRTYLVDCSEASLGKLNDMADAMLESCGGSCVMEIARTLTMLRIVSKFAMVETDTVPGIRSTAGALFSV